MVCGYTAERPSYLFQTETGTVEFVVIAEEMEQLHNFWVLCLESSRSKLNQTVQDHAALSKITAVEDEFVDFADRGIVSDYLREVEIPKWSSINAWLIHAMCLLLLSSLVERSLKWLCMSFSPHGAKFKSHKGSMSKTAAYIDFLQHDCGLLFEEPADLASIREDCRILRNGFAHGDWDAVQTKINAQFLQDAFEAHSMLFREIESARELIPSSN